jgi:uncharacterized spore protein YtfJ
MSQGKITEVVSTLLSGVKSIAKSETIVGEPQQAGEATVIPVHRVKIAFGAASASAGARGARGGGDTGGHGAGGAVELEPVAAIAVAKDGSAHLLTVDGDDRGAWSSLLHDVPDILGKLAHALGERVQGELGGKRPEAAEPAVSAQAPEKSLPKPRE